MNTKKIIELQNKIFSEIKNLWDISENWIKSNLILDNFLDELNMKKTPENRFIAYSRISELRVESLELFLDNMAEKINSPLPQGRGARGEGLKIPNKLQNKIEILNKAYNYVSNIYEDLQEKFIYELEKQNLVNSFELKIFKWVLNVWKAFNKFMPVWENHIIKQNDILDKRFDGDSEKIMQFLREKNLLEMTPHPNSLLKEREQKVLVETDRSYSVLKAWKIVSYYEAFGLQVNSIIIALQDFIEDLTDEESEEKQNYINYLKAIKEAFEEKYCTKLLAKWQKVDEAWMKIKGPLQISHPLEFYEDKYRKAVAPEWDLRILDTETLDSKVKENIEKMYEEIYTSPLTPLLRREGNSSFPLKEKYNESYNFSKDNFNRVQLYISEPVLYFGSELNWMFSAQVVPNDEIVSEKFGKKIFAFPKMVLESKKKAPLMKLTKEVLSEDLLKDYLAILDNDKLFFQIYDIETIGHEFGHTLWLTKTTEIEMNKKTGNFKNIEEFKATIWWLNSYFYWNDLWKKFNKNLVIMHLVRCIWLLKYREITEVLPYYNESLIHLDIMFEAWIFKIKNNKIILNFSEKTWEKFIQNYKKHYLKLIQIYLDKIEAWEFLYDYIETDKKWNNFPKNKNLKEFVEYYYDLYKEIGNEVD